MDTVQSPSYIFWVERMKKKGKKKKRREEEENKVDELLLHLWIVSAIVLMYSTLGLVVDVKVQVAYVPHFGVVLKLSNFGVFSCIFDRNTKCLRLIVRSLHSVSKGPPLNVIARYFKPYVQSYH